MALGPIGGLICELLITLSFGSRSSNNNMTVQAAERLLHSLRKDLGLLKIRYCVTVLLWVLV